MFCHVAEQETLYLHRVVRIGTDGAGDKVVGTLILRIVLVFSIDNKPWCDSAAKANVNRLRTPLGDPSQVYRALGIAPFGRDPPQGDQRHISHQTCRQFHRRHSVA